jgi:hypothetical protein
MNLDMTLSGPTDSVTAQNAPTIEANTCNAGPSSMIPRRFISVFVVS